MQPLGFSRLLSVIEVMLGLALMGMLIAKLTSSRLSYQVKRLYISDSHRQLYRHLNRIRNNSSELDLSIQNFSLRFSDIPQDKTDSHNQENFQKILERARRSFSSNFLKLSKSIEDLKSYIDLEAANSDFFNEVSSELLKDIGTSISEMINKTYQFLNGISDNKRPHLLYGEPGRFYNNTIKAVVAVCKTIRSQCDENSVNSIYNNTENLCSKINDQIIIVSVPVYEAGPPDQIIDDKNG